MIHEAVGEARLIVDNQRNAVRSGNVGRANNREFIPRNCGAEMNPDDTAPGYSTAHRSAMEHTRKAQIIHIFRLPSNLFPALFARNGKSNHGRFHVETMSMLLLYTRGRQSCMQVGR